MTDKESVATQMLTPMAIAFSTLINEHEPLALGDDETPAEYVTTLTFTHDTERDVIGIDAQFSPDIENYDTLASMPDSFQMMNLLVMQFLEGVGAINEQGEPNDHFIDPELPSPAPRQLH